MAEDNKTVTPDGAENAQGPDNLTEHRPAPPAPEIESGEASLCAKFSPRFLSVSAVYLA